MASVCSSSGGIAALEVGAWGTAAAGGAMEACGAKGVRADDEASCVVDLCAYSDISGS